MKRLQHEKIATWKRGTRKVYNTEKVQHEKIST